VDGVYIDQIAAAISVPCSDPSHAHSTTGGDYWYHGYETLLDHCHHYAHDQGKNNVLVTGKNQHKIKH
jgi:hypothetical protein